MIMLCELYCIDMSPSETWVASLSKIKNQSRVRIAADRKLGAGSVSE